MNYSSRLLDEYEDRKPSPLAQTPINRPAHLAIPRHSSPFPRPPPRSVMDPNESFMSMGGGGGNQSFLGSTQGVSSWSEERIQMLQARLARKLGPEYVTQRPGPGGGPKLSYIEGWKVINLANEVFGFNGWSSSIVSLKTDFIDEKEGGRVSVNVTAIIRITLHDGCFHEDVGCGQGENIRGKSAALDKAQKEAVTDATKRALRTFGNVLGNCLYDKEYTKEVVKMRVPPAKFNQNELERRPEFTTAGASATAGASSSRPAIPVPVQPVPSAARAAIPIQAPQPIRSPKVAPGTPLRSVNDPSGDVFMDESFDADFMDMGSDSFLNQIEERSIQAGPSMDNGSSDIGNGAQAGPSRPPQQNDVPAYQHRHRPDMPQQAQAGSSRPSPATVAAPTARYDRNPAPALTGAPDVKPEFKPNSGSSKEGSTPSSNTVPDAPPKPRPVGGFAPPNAGGNASAKEAAAARRQAIASAFNTSPAVNDNNTRTNGEHCVQPSPPIRAESPRIPSGGIDAVAARATTKLRADGVPLKLDENGFSEDGENVTLGGFTSARGMKRPGAGSGDVGRLSASPTKASSGYGQQNNGYNRSGARMALGELNSAGAGGGGGGEDWNVKRSRMV